MNLISQFKSCIFLLLVFVANQSIGQTISIQSTVKDQNGKAVADGPVSITFKLYTVASGGTDVWNETATNVEVEGGVYSHQLGSVNPLPVAIFGSQLYLGVTIAGGQELIPRTILSYAPYSLATTAIANSGQSASFEPSGQLKITQDAIVIDQLGVKVPALTTLASSVDLAIGDNNTGLNQNAEDVLQVVTGGTARMTIGSTGKVAFGVTPNNAMLPDIAFGDDDTGLNQNGDGILQLVANNIPTVTVTSSRIGVGIAPSNTTVCDMVLGDDDTGLNQNGDGVLQVVTNNAARITVLANGRVGIGTSTPEATLDINPNSNAGDPSTLGGSYFNAGGNSIVADGSMGGFVNNIGLAVNAEALINGRITAFNNLVWSDYRCKNIIGKSDAQSDLELIKKLEITNYSFIDKKQNGNILQKKLIAQQVESVFPQAVTTNHHVIPNVYELASSFSFSGQKLTISTNKAHDFIAGDQIDIITPQSILKKVEVLKIIDANTFEISANEKPDNIFVYGKWVNDFKGVDYDAIAMLNVSATQELIRKIESLEKTVNDLNQKNNNLNSDNERLKKDSFGLENRLSRIEGVLSEYLNKKEITASGK